MKVMLVYRTRPEIIKLSATIPKLQKYFDTTTVFTTQNYDKNLLNLNANKLDDYDSSSLKDDYYKKTIKLKTKLLLEKIRKIKSNGKKNSS